MEIKLNVFFFSKKKQSSSQAVLWWKCSSETAHFSCSSHWIANGTILICNEANNYLESLQINHYIAIGKSLSKYNKKNSETMVKLWDVKMTRRTATRPLVFQRCENCKSTQYTCKRVDVPVPVVVRMFQSSHNCVSHQDVAWGPVGSLALLLLFLSLR